MKAKLFYEEKKHDAFIEKIKNGFKALEDGKNELQKQGVTGVTCEDIKSCNFLKVFEDFHKSQQWKNDITKTMIFEKYLELYGYGTEQLKKLEMTYHSYLNQVDSFFEMNDSFYRYCQRASHNNARLKVFVENAPRVKSYKLLDFLKIKGDNYEISVPQELFVLYATNQKQLDIIENVKTFVNVAKKLGIQKKDILKPLNEFVLQPNTNWGIESVEGLSNDLSTINFDYDKLLTIQ